MHLSWHPSLQCHFCLFLSNLSLWHQWLRLLCFTCRGLLFLYFFVCYFYLIIKNSSSGVLCRGHWFLYHKTWPQLFSENQCLPLCIWFAMQCNAAKLTAQLEIWHCHCHANARADKSGRKLCTLTSRKCRFTTHIRILRNWENTITFFFELNFNLFVQFGCNVSRQPTF